MSFLEKFYESHFSSKESQKYKNMSITQIMDISRELSQELPSADYDNSTMFDFYVNPTMQGFPHPCSDIKCRINNLEKTLRFGSLYAERLVFVNRFESIISDIERNEDKIELNYFRYMLMTEIAIQKKLKPFIDGGLIKFGCSSIHLCDSCLQKNILNENRDDFTKKLIKTLESNYLDEIQVSYKKEFGSGLLLINGAEEIIPHGAYVSQVDSEAIEKLLKIPSNTQNILLSNEAIKEIGVTSNISNELFTNIVFGNFYSDVYGTQNLTDNQFEFNINNYYKTRNTSSSIMDTLEHSMPFVLDVEVSKIYELRKSNEDAFNNYRELVRGAIKSVKDVDDEFEKTQVFADIIRPGINEVEQKINNSKNILLKTLTKDVAITAGSIYLASNNTFFDPNIANYIAAGGGIEVFKDIVKTTKDLLNPEKIIKDDKFYFLWKLNKLAPKV